PIIHVLILCRVLVLDRLFHGPRRKVRAWRGQTWMLACSVGHAQPTAATVPVPCRQPGPGRPACVCPRRRPLWLGGSGHRSLYARIPGPVPAATLLTIRRAVSL